MYQILTDSECDLPLATLEDSDVKAISFHIKVNDQELINDLGKSYDINDFYKQIKAGVLPTTTQVNVGEYYEFFEPYVKAKTPIVYIGFSGGLSGSMSSAIQAKEMLLETYPKADIRIIDTLAASGGEGQLVLAAIRLQKSGASLDKLVKWFDQNKLSLQQWFTVDNLNYLYHGGRISRTSAALGTILKVKPILDVDPAGKLRLVSKTRTRKKSLLELAEKICKDLKDDPYQPIIITTSGDYEAAEIVKKAILAKFSEADIQVYPIGMTISSHTGFGCVAAFAMGKQPRN
ncbi:DegV family protein [Companilactobacillus halodurans]|uniref:DegV family protein n=1 Tax=Companilactobacillus halodurans TaxID=2584183 RepID=A0A5P0ZPK4_9LACO|nr:DegV family protein [Companilactobacillus halodurans]MQS76173.1 DegV family protein [Companilactobacillus halodurans]MQS98631.1 DegV family protein [Companilactobacillus halodurans]